MQDEDWKYLEEYRKNLEVDKCELDHCLKDLLSHTI